MRPQEHANLLSIFFWVYAGLQTLMALLIALYIGVFGVMTVMMAVDGSHGSGSGAIVFGVIIFFFVLILLFGITSIVLNIMAGVGLRKRKPWTKKCATAAAILSILSFICGGIFLLPFGVGLGIYGLWFLLGEVGKNYFYNLETGNPQINMYPPNPPNWR